MGDRIVLYLWQLVPTGQLMPTLLTEAETTHTLKVFL